MSDRRVWIPAALSPDEVRLKQELLESLVNPEVAQELRGYVEDCFRRLLTTLELVPPGGGRVLELGANPYFFTILLSRARDYELTLANFFGRTGEGTQTVVHAATGERREFHYREFNIEEDAFPYPDASFDGVVYGEILEHLVRDPVQVLAEIHRVLRPGGWLVLTTPNVARRQNVLALLRGRNVYDPYSGYGAYGRHNREYTSGELRELLTGTGFAVERLFTRDLHPAGPASRALAWALGPASGYNLYALARRGPEFRWYFPPWLFRSGTRRRHVRDPFVRVGVNDAVQVGAGWYDAERWPVGLARWTTGRAEAYVLARGGEQRLWLDAYGGPKELPGTRRVSVTLEPAGAAPITLTASLVTGAWSQAELKLATPLPAGETLVRLEVAPFVPGDILKSADRRQLGVAVRELGVAA